MTKKQDAEVTLKKRHRLSQALNSAQRALLSYGDECTVRNGVAIMHANLFSGVAAIDAEQTGTLKRAGCSTPEKEVEEEEEEEKEEVVILNRDIAPAVLRHGAAAPREDSAVAQRVTTASQDYATFQDDTASSQKDTASSQKNTAFSQADAAFLAATSTFSCFSIVSSSTINHVNSPATVTQRPSQTKFDNVAPPFFRALLPKPSSSPSSTLQLSFACHLVRKLETSQPSCGPGSSRTDEVDIQAMGLEAGEQSWLSHISMHPAEQGRLRRLAAQVVVQFLHSYRMTETQIAEVGLLASVLERQDYRDVLSSLIERFDKDKILHLELLQGLVCFLQSASPGYLIEDDLVSILRILRNRLVNTHTQVGSSQHTHLLVAAVSRVLDTMVEGKVNDLRRVEEQEPLLKILDDLKDSPDPYLRHQATYAWQALQYVGDEEPPLQMAVRVGGQLITAGLGVANAFKLDTGGLFDGLRVLAAAAEQAVHFTKAVTENARTARDGGAGVMNSVLVGFQLGIKRAWYPALQGARVFIREGRLSEFERTVYNAPCCREQDFKWGVCQLLGEIALDPIWGTQIRQQAVYFLEDLNSDDSRWIGDSSVRGAIRGILRNVSEKAENQIHVNPLPKVPELEDVNSNDEPYPLITRLSIPQSFPLLAKALKATPLEDKLGRILARQLEAYEPQVYIPPNAMAKPLVSYESLLASTENPAAPDNKCSSLMDMAMDFLQSKRQVFLIKGNSGSGKSTFNKHLSYVLLKEYQQGGRIPLFIDLPTAKDPQHDLVPGHLQMLGFGADEIQELKQDRRFILICDAYDETRLKVNLHTTNMLNRRNEWQVKMIISCRSSNTGTNYKDNFQPQPTTRYDRSTPHLFQEADIIAFSGSQIEDYVKQFVQGDEVRELFDDRPVWSAAEYMDKLRKITNLLGLVTNPFLLSISLKLLPAIFKDDSAAPISITESKLIDIFIQEWLDVNRKRLMDIKQFEAELEELVREGFIETGINFLSNLAATMLSEQQGHYVVEYKHKDHKHTWKANFFGPDEKVTLLREASPLVKVDNLHSFMHRSLFDYFVVLYMRSESSKKQQTHPIQEHPTTEISGRKISSCHHRIANGAGPAAGVASGPTRVATGALVKVDGVWKRTVQVVTTRKAYVDHLCPIAKTSYVYYDHEVYDSVLTEKSTGITYVTQLIFDSETKVYYVYYRWGETDYKLDGPHETIESAKEAFQVTYKEKFDVEWKARETTTSEKWTYEFKTYEEIENIEEIEEVYDESEAKVIIAREKEAVVDGSNVREHTTTTVTQEEVTVEHVTEETVVVEETEEHEKPAKVVTITKETGVVVKPAVPEKSSWFRRALSSGAAAVAGAGAIAAGATSGAGQAASGALTKVDGVWKRTVNVLTTRKAHVDHVCPIAKTSYVYYDDDVYDAVLTEKSTGITHVTQLIFDRETKVYYVYYRWGETDYNLDGPHETIKSAKEAFQLNYKEEFEVEWEERETTTSEKWVYEVNTYETFEEVEEIEEVIEETEAECIIAREETEIIDTKITEETTTTVTKEEVTLEHLTKETVVVEETEEHDTVKGVLVTKETGVITQPAVSEKSSWFRRALSSGAAAVAGAGAIAAGATSGAGEAASGALTKVDGVWKRTVNVLTTRKAHVDHVCPIAKTSYVYYDDDVYDAVLIEKSTGITYVTQLIFDSETKAYYVYYRCGETDYKLDGPHETIESAKAAFQVTYKEKFDVEWKEREIATSERWTYEVKTYETFEEIEEVEEVVEETEVQAIIARERTEHTGTTETVAETGEVVLEHVAKESIVFEGLDMESDEIEDETDAEVANENVMDDEGIVDTDVPSSSLHEFTISGMPASLGDMTVERLVREMSASPVFDDQKMGIIDLAEEPDILRFLVDQVEEDPAYTKQLLWTVYKSGGEGINQSTRNAMCILKKAGIQFHLQR